MKHLLIAATLFGVSAASFSVHANDGAAGPGHSPCDVSAPSAQWKIEVDGERHASVCRADGAGDCLYSFAAGKTFVLDTPDMNGDGQSDYLIKDFSGAYGMHDVVHVMGFVRCPRGFYVKVLDDVLSEVSVKEPDPTTSWRELAVSRACFDEKSGDTISRRYVLHFDKETSTYGPPDDNKALAPYCSADELASPAPTGR